MDVGIKEIIYHQREEWLVEAIDMESDGEIYRATFSGPLAKERAAEYVEMKYGEGDEAKTPGKANTKYV